MKLRVALAQLEPVPGSPRRNLEKVVSVVEGYDADLYVFPELFLNGYTSQDILYRTAMDLGSEEIERVRGLARACGVGIVIGFAERSSMGFLYNSLLAVDERGGLYVYRKRHLPTFSVFDEHRWFRQWRGSIDPWTFRGTSIGFGICYDVFFPEIFKCHSLRGAKILVAISASPDTSVPLFHVLARARALENTCFFVWVNNTGVLDGLTFGGGSLAVDPMGNIIAELRRGVEDIRVVELDLRAVERARIARPVIRDSMIEDSIELLRSYRAFEGLESDTL